MRPSPYLLLAAAAVIVQSIQLAGQSPSSDNGASSSRGGSLPVIACVSTVSAQRPSVVGRVADADRNEAVTGASVSLSWLEVRYDNGAGLRIIGRTQDVRTGANGHFEFCDLDPDLEASLSASIAKRSTAPVHVSLSDEPFATRVLFLPAAEDSMEARAAGGMVVRGTVIGDYDLGLGDARVEIRDFTESARTRDDGSFSLPTRLSGTQVMRVRRVGYEEAETPIDLTAGNVSPVVIRLEKTPPSLETIDVRERMSEVIERSGFARRARSGPGQYITAVDIALHRAPCAADYIAPVPGFTVRRTGRRCEASIGVQRGLTAASPQSGATRRASCVALVVDDEKVEDISALQPRDVVGMELYRMATDPVRNGERKCATILIWTVRYAGPPL
jgi:Carboxypeptidase regulatory-like domain